MRSTVTIPAAGNKKALKLSGRSVLIEQMPVYQSAADVPTIDFRPGTSNYPLYPRSTYPNAEGKFDSIEIIGTAASAGDEITLITSNECLALDININLAQTGKSIAGPTWTKLSNDNVQSFTDPELISGNGLKPKRLYIFVVGGTSRGINYAFDADPSQGENATDALYWNNSLATGGETQRKDNPLEIVGIDWIKSFRFIATVAGETPTLVITAEY